MQGSILQIDVMITCKCLSILKNIKLLNVYLIQLFVAEVGVVLALGRTEMLIECSHVSVSVQRIWYEIKNKRKTKG